ncbi:hypothetical protein [Pseudomonas sp. TCU-HL1]|uniref:hypothetical protein n=1 Tax=Pseudomonas sp. TCU-HL1 TaxID=1856685 RepID=UPI0008590A0F|nr:hypothetical protein [Pseudomonas sp. TCU-HL1]AOE84504.1 sugar ABC transporter substrate-binding protein [Pseudomonas sp. TCU-HL1]
MSDAWIRARKRFVGANSFAIEIAPTGLASPNQEPPMLDMFDMFDGIRLILTGVLADLALASA